MSYKLFNISLIDSELMSSRTDTDENIIIVESGITDLKKKKVENRREEDLRGALDNKSKDEDEEIDKETPLTPLEKLIQDNQISRAVDLIRGISLFNNKVKINSTASINENSLIKKTDSVKN